MSYHNVTVSILEHSASQGKLGFNLGGGAEYALTEKVSLGAEVRYQQISDFNQVVLGLGATFKL